MKRALSSPRSKRFRVVSEQRKTEERRGTGAKQCSGGGGEWKIRSPIEVEQEVIITNNNLLFHFSGHNNDLVL